VPTNPLEAVISVVIPARDAAASVGTLLRSLVPDLGLIHEILLVDDGSGDATAAIATDTAQRLGLPLRILPAAFSSAGAARNFGMAQAQGRFLFFIDVDDELVPGALGILAAKFTENPAAGLAIGACIRQTANREDKIKVPHGYSGDRQQNVIRYLANKVWPIAMGSALFLKSEATGLQFPENIGLDEDTCFWTALLTRVQVVTTAAPVLIYKLDEARMARRYTVAPRKTLLNLSRAFRKLARYGVPRTALRQRTAWVALRIARQLIMNREYVAAKAILRLVRAHPRFRRTWTFFRYRCRIQAGLLAQSLGLRPPPVTSGKFTEVKGQRRILIITVDDVSAPVSGSDLRNHQIARSAAKLGSVAVVSIRPAKSEAVKHSAGLEFLSVGIQGERSKAIASARCRIEVRISCACLSRLLGNIEKFQPDTIIVGGIPLASLLKHLRPLAKLLILDMQNIESDLAAQRLARMSVKERFAAICRRDVSRIRHLEKRALKSVDQIWVCSKEDQTRLVNGYRAMVPIQIIPNTIPRFKPLADEYQPQNHKNKAGPVLLFIGHLGYWPNVVAAQRLAHGILPAVRRRFPDATVILAGRHPQPAVQALSTLPGVELHANPECLQTFYERADVVVVPLSAGGGTRLKILEAMAAGLPVVSTPVGAEGLGLIANEEVLLAESDEDLARHVIWLCENPDGKAKQMGFAEKTVRLRFGTEAVDLAVKQSL